MQLLLVEDDPVFVGLVRRGLQEQGHAIDVATSCADARALAGASRYDVIVLDVQLPDGSGIDLVREMRAEGRATPVLVLTGLRGTDHIIAVLDAGADDFLSKPFSIDVLSARLRALARRDATVRRPLVPVGDVLLDPTHTRVIVRGERRPLTPREFALLDYLAQRAEQVVTRSELLDKVWSMQFDPGTNLIDVHVGRLRRKLRGAECVVIRTVRSLGYLLTTAPGGDVPSDAP